MGPKRSTEPEWPAVWAFLLGHLDEIVEVFGPTEERVDLAYQFAIDRLPGVMLAVRELPRVEAGRYLRASARNFARSASRRTAREARALSALADLSAEDAGVRDRAERTVTEVRAAMTPLQNAALAGYFGLDEPARSVRVVAAQLGVSRYAAGAAITDGLAAAALVLGAHDELGAAVVAACRAVLVDGEPVSAAASGFGVRSDEVRRGLTRVRAVALAGSGERPESASVQPNRRTER